MIEFGQQCTQNAQATREFPMKEENSYLSGKHQLVIKNTQKSERNFPNTNSNDFGNFLN